VAAHRGLVGGALTMLWRSTSFTPRGCPPRLQALRHLQGPQKPKATSGWGRDEGREIGRKEGREGGGSEGGREEGRQGGEGEGRDLCLNGP